LFRSSNLSASGFAPGSDTSETITIGVHISDAEVSMSPRVDPAVVASDARKMRPHVFQRISPRNGADLKKGDESSGKI
jgi:hypothetical protein